MSSHISDNILQKLKGRGVPLGKQSPFIPFRRVWKDSTHFPLASEGPASCSCVQMWHQVPPARCRAQAGFEVGVSYSLPSGISHAADLLQAPFILCNPTPLSIAISLSVLWVLSGKQENSVFLRSFSAEPFQPPSYMTRPLEP